MLVKLIRVIGGFYGLFGMVNIATFFYLFAFGDFTSHHYRFIVDALGTPLVIAVVSFIIMYCFWTLKKLGRYLAIGFSGVGIVEFGWGYKLNQVKTSMEVVYIFFFFIVPVSIIVFCLHPKIRNVMRH